MVRSSETQAGQPAAQTEGRTSAVAARPVDASELYGCPAGQTSPAVERLLRALRRPLPRSWGETTHQRWSIARKSAGRFGSFTWLGVWRPVRQPFADTVASPTYHPRSDAKRASPPGHGGEAPGATRPHGQVPAMGSWYANSRPNSLQRLPSYPALPSIP